MPTRSRRRLPHQYPSGRALFLTWHLHGSLPATQYNRPSNWTAGKAFVWADRHLDRSDRAPLWLNDPEIAQIVADALHYAEAELRHIHLHAWVIMPNHVHTLVEPLVSPTRFLRTLKSFTAKQANKLLDRTGEPFWQKESFDHWIRNKDEWNRVHAYIENNPVTAGLVTIPEAWPWSSATKHP